MRDIKTAPKDGAQFIASDNGDYVVAWWPPMKEEFIVRSSTLLYYSETGFYERFKGGWIPIQGTPERKKVKWGDVEIELPEGFEKSPDNVPVPGSKMLDNLGRWRNTIRAAQYHEESLIIRPIKPPEPELKQEPLYDTVELTHLYNGEHYDIQGIQVVNNSGHEIGFAFQICRDAPVPETPPLDDGSWYCVRHEISPYPVCRQYNAEKHTFTTVYGDEGEDAEQYTVISKINMDDEEENDE